PPQYCLRPSSISQLLSLIFHTTTQFSSFSFFFYCSGHHRDLHSFPTRRSSDLQKCANHGSTKPSHSADPRGHLLYRVVDIATFGRDPWFSDHYFQRESARKYVDCRVCIRSISDLGHWSVHDLDVAHSLGILWATRVDAGDGRVCIFFVHGVDAGSSRRWRRNWIVVRHHRRGYCYRVLFFGCLAPQPRAARSCTSCTH